VDRRNLTDQKRLAGSDLIGLGIAVSRGAAFQDIADVNLLPFQTHRLDDFCQELAGESYKGSSLGVLIRPRRLAYKNKIRPRVICALGTFAAHALLKSEAPISVLRGRFHSYQGIPLMPTYHPAYLLRNPGAKKQVWDDVQVIMKELNK
jgi:hypothetical protein